MPIDHRTDPADDCRTAIAASDAHCAGNDLKTHKFFMASRTFLFNELIFVGQ